MKYAIALLALVIYIPIVHNDPEPPTAVMSVGNLEHEADIWIGRPASELYLQIDAYSMLLTGCFEGDICDTAIDPPSQLSAWKCELTDVEDATLVMKCEYPMPWRGQYDMRPRMTVFEDGSFAMTAWLPVPY
jgi:hypothetical protein